MVDPERLRRILQAVADDVHRLRRYQSMARADVLADEVEMGNLLRRFQTAIEGCIDAAQHVCASEGWGPPDSNAHAMLLLAEHGVLPEDLGVSMADHARFRNVLVHIYVTVDNGLVFDRLSRLAELDRYVAAMAVLIV